MKHYAPADHHFFASSASTWMATNETRGLHDVIKAMEKEGLLFNLFLVPVAHTAEYEIRAYRPRVDGVVWLGTFDPKEKLA